MVALLGGVSLSRVHQISDRLGGNIIVLPLPTLGSSETEVIDLGGQTQSYTITGIFESTSVADTKLKVESLKALMNASQKPIVLLTDQTGSKNVLIRSVDFTWDITETPTSVIAGYSVTVVETRGN